MSHCLYSAVINHVPAQMEAFHFVAHSQALHQVAQVVYVVVAYVVHIVLRSRTVGPPSYLMSSAMAFASSLPKKLEATHDPRSTKAEVRQFFASQLCQGLCPFALYLVGIYCLREVVQRSMRSMCSLSFIACASCITPLSPILLQSKGGSKHVHKRNSVKVLLRLNAEPSSATPSFSILLQPRRKLLLLKSRRVNPLFSLRPFAR